MFLLTPKVLKIGADQAEYVSYSLFVGPGSNLQNAKSVFQSLTTTACLKIVMIVIAKFLCPPEKDYSLEFIYVVSL